MVATEGLRRQEEQRKKQEAEEAKLREGKSNASNWSKAVVQILTGDETALRSAVRGDTKSLLANAQQADPAMIALQATVFIAFIVAGEGGARMGRRSSGQGLGVSNRIVPEDVYAEAEAQGTPIQRGGNVDAMLNDLVENYNNLEPLQQHQASARVMQAQREHYLEIANEAYRNGDMETYQANKETAETYESIRGRHQREADHIETEAREAKRVSNESERNAIRERVMQHMREQEQIHGLSRVPLPEGDIIYMTGREWSNEADFTSFVNDYIRHRMSDQQHSMYEYRQENGRYPQSYEELESWGEESSRRRIIEQSEESTVAGALAREAPAPAPAPAPEPHSAPSGGEDNRRRIIESEDPTGFTTKFDDVDDYEYVHLKKSDIMFALQEADDAYYPADKASKVYENLIESVEYSTNGKCRFTTLKDGTRWITFRGTNIDESQVANVVEKLTGWGAEAMKMNTYTKPYAKYAKRLKKFFKIGTQYIMGGFDDVLTDAGAVFVNLQMGLGIPAIMEKLPADLQGIVHMNFAHHVAEVYDDVYRFLQKRKPQDRFYVNGHSLGAVAAQIFTLRYFLETGEKAARLYTFASPRGLELFGNFFDETFEHINIYDKNDIVPLFFPMIYTCGGYKVIVDSKTNTYEKYSPDENPPDLVVNEDITYDFMRRKQFNWGVSSVPDGQKEDPTEFLMQPEGETSELSRLENQYERLARNPRGEQVRAFAESMSYELQQNAVAKAVYHSQFKGGAEAHRIKSIRRQVEQLEDYVAFIKKGINEKPWYHKLHKQMTFPSNWEQQVQAWNDELRLKNYTGNWSESLEMVSNETGGTLQSFRQNTLRQFNLPLDTPVLGFVQYTETERQAFEYKLIYYK